jgi:hypothetical protein
MKRILSSICIGTLALAVTAPAADNDNIYGRKARVTQSQTATVKNTTPAATTRFSQTGQVKTQQNFNSTRFRPHNYSVSSQTNSNAVARRNFVQQNKVNTTQNFNANRVNRFRQQHNNVTLNNQSNVKVRRAKTVGVNRAGNFAVNHNQNLTVNRQRNINRNIAINNNWRGQNFSGRQYSAFRNYNRQWHSRNWWRSHNNRIVFVLGGWYFWNSGYWYPAWGYDPGYSYPYDGPIYGYNDLAPDQVVVNVQEQLQQDGYYTGPVDGVLGPMTRQAIAAFQADHGLAVTSAVDEPTLATLGLV